MEHVDHPQLQFLFAIRYSLFACAVISRRFAAK
jgi:hypothetical protein